LGKPFLILMKREMMEWQWQSVLVTFFILTVASH